MIIQYYFFSPSICIQVETELNKKKVIYLSKENTIQLEFIEAFYV